MKEIARVLTQEQRAALQQYAAEHGRSWKQDLHADWMHARAQVRGETSPELQQIRNSFGPSWLMKFKLNA